MAKIDTLEPVEGNYASLLACLTISAVQTEYEVLRLMRQCASHFGFLHFMITRMPAGEQQSFSERLVVSSWPSDLVRGYDALGTFASSMLVEQLRHTKLPIFAETASLMGTHQMPLSAASTGPVTGNTFAALFHTTYAEPFILTLSGNRAAPRSEEAAQIHYMLLHLFERLERAMDAGVAPRERLSTRELECLRWAAAGKSSDEIAIILGISAYTVSSYFKTAARKLDAVNRMQAIARALRLKLI